MGRFGFAYGNRRSPAHCNTDRDEHCDHNGNVHRNRDPHPDTDANANRNSNANCYANPGSNGNENNGGTATDRYPDAHTDKAGIEPATVPAANGHSHADSPSTHHAREPDLATCSAHRAAAVLRGAVDERRIRNRRRNGTRSMATPRWRVAADSGCLPRRLGCQSPVNDEFDQVAAPGRTCNSWPVV